MKKFIFSLGLIATVIGLTNCSQEHDFGSNANKVQEFVLHTSISESRTTNSGENTLWAENDNLNVFHAVSESDAYVNDGEFNIQDVATGYFKGELGSALSAEKSYDWYAFYPYSTTHSKPGEGRSYIIGNTNNVAKQTQNGNNNMSHLAGSNFPLMGVTKGVAANETPTLAMRNVASLAKFIVKNALSESITITNISFKVPGQHLTGYFYVDFTDIENVIYTPESDKTSDNANLVISNGSAIAAGASAEFYLAIAPFAKADGEEVTFTITATNKDGVVGECVKSTNAALTFTQGLHKDITINYNTPFENLPSVSTENEPYIVGFESSEGFDATSTYKVADIRYTGPENKQWGTVYGTPSTTGKISGAQSIHMKIYKINNVWTDSYTFTNFVLSTVKEVSFKASSESDNQIKLSYKTAGGEWKELNTFALSSTAKTCKYTFDSAVKNAQFKFTIVNDNPTDAKGVVIDDVTFSSTVIEASVVATTKSATGTESTSGDSATLNGEYCIVNEGGDEEVTCGFEYKLSSASDYTSVIANNATSFSAEVTGLTVGEEYTYRAWASLDGGATKVYGESASFTTTKADVVEKCIELTNEDISSISDAWDYKDTNVHSVTINNNTWSAYKADKDGGAKSIMVKALTDIGYLATPIVNGSITKIVINIKSAGVGTQFKLTTEESSSATAFYTSSALGKNTQDWSVDITNNCNQIYIKSKSGTLYINSVTVYYK